MSDAEPPWREVTSDDFYPRIFPDNYGGAAWIAHAEAARTIIQGQVDGEYRIRFVLREAVDLKRGPRSEAQPRWLYSYDLGNGWMEACADEVLIAFRDGRREVVPIPKPGDDGQWPGWCWAGGRRS